MTNLDSRVERREPLRGKRAPEISTGVLSCLQPNTNLHKHKAKLCKLAKHNCQRGTDVQLPKLFQKQGQKLQPTFPIKPCKPETTGDYNFKLPKIKMLNPEMCIILFHSHSLTNVQEFSRV